MSSVNDRSTDGTTIVPGFTWVRKSGFVIREKHLTSTDTNVGTNSTNISDIRIQHSSLRQTIFANRKYVNFKTFVVNCLPHGQLLVKDH